MKWEDRASFTSLTAFFSERLEFFFQFWEWQFSRPKSVTALYQRSMSIVKKIKKIKLWSSRVSHDRLACRQWSGLVNESIIVIFWSLEKLAPEHSCQHECKKLDADCQAEVNVAEYIRTWKFRLFYPKYGYLPVYSAWACIIIAFRRSIVPQNAYHINRRSKVH